MDRITDRPDMTSAVDRGHKALTQQQTSVMEKGPRDKNSKGIKARVMVLALCMSYNAD